MSTATLLLAGGIDAAALAQRRDGWELPAHVELLAASRAADDPLAPTAYGARWPYAAVVSLDAPGRDLADLTAHLAGIVDSFGSLVDRAGSTAVAGTTHRIIDGRTDVALVYVIHRLADITNEQYRDHWRNRHGPLAKELVPTRGYEQLHADLAASTGVNDELGFGDAAYDGVATCFFDTRDDFAAMLTAREASLDMNVIYEDEQRFLDHGRSFGAMVRTAGGGPGTL